MSLLGLGIELGFGSQAPVEAKSVRCAKKWKGVPKRGRKPAINIRTPSRIRSNNVMNRVFNRGEQQNRVQIPASADLGESNVAINEEKAGPAPCQLRCVAMDHIMNKHPIPSRMSEKRTRSSSSSSRKCNSDSASMKECALCKKAEGRSKKGEEASYQHYYTIQEKEQQCHEPGLQPWGTTEGFLPRLFNKVLEEEVQNTNLLDADGAATLLHEIRSMPNKKQCFSFDGAVGTFAFYRWLTNAYDIHAITVIGRYLENNMINTDNYAKFRFWFQKVFRKRNTTWNAFKTCFSYQDMANRLSSTALD
ncbi:unnamed protein product, partial [Notodromas monacha]